MTILQEEFPNVPISLSSVILPELMEYERTLVCRLFSLFSNHSLILIITDIGGFCYGEAKGSLVSR